MIINGKRALAYPVIVEEIKSIDGKVSFKNVSRKYLEKH